MNKLSITSKFDRSNFWVLLKFKFHTYKKKKTYIFNCFKNHLYEKLPTFFYKLKHNKSIEKKKKKENFKYLWISKGQKILKIIYYCLVYNNKNQVSTIFHFWITISISHYTYFFGTILKNTGNFYIDHFQSEITLKLKIKHFF